MDTLQAQRDYKARNILTTAQRIKVIQAFDRIPNFQRLARMFGCSAKQIKNILSNQHKILAHYKNARANKMADEIAARRQAKIDFLGKVVYEFLLRSLYLRIPVGTTIIRQKAFEVKEAIAIENFSPNQAWLEDFKSTYNRLDFSNMMEDLPADMNKRQSLRSVDLIEYVSKQERETSSKPTMADDNCNSMWGDNECISAYNSKQSSIEKYIEESQDEYFNIYAENSTLTNAMREYGRENSNLNDINNVPVEVKLELDDEHYNNKERNEEDSFVKTKKRKYSPNCSTSSSAPTIPGAQAPPPPSLPDIHSYLEALSHLKVLEDFAMIEENYRAIGLITQLEQIFKNPPKLKQI